MALEIERKFLVSSNNYKIGSKRLDITQAYLKIEKNFAIRIRIQDVYGTLSIKSKTSDRVNEEFEYDIPIDEAKIMIEMSNYTHIVKTRHIVNYKKHVWEVDEFHGDNKGLVVAEIELKDELEKFDKPEWIGLEVTSDYRYLNSNLVKKPFSDW
jgi:CYTH domain-containing protein